MSSTPSQQGPVEASPTESSLDASLRPGLWDEYIGQDQIKANLNILLSAARQRGQCPEHVLFYGPAGLGKTTLAHLIAREIGTSLKLTSGPAIERVGDLASILTNLSPGDILFIDEIHPSQPRHRRSPLPCHGVGSSRHHHRQGTFGTHRTTRTSSVYTRCRNHAHRIALVTIAFAFLGWNIPSRFLY
jgi:SpoVK/Ycf46/Vps4 family AAA+-type ATPase